MLYGDSFPTQFQVITANDLDVSRIHCYLCNVYFIANMDEVSDISVNSDIRRHIHGQRHQGLIRENLSLAPDEAGQVSTIHFPLQFINSQDSQNQYGRSSHNIRYTV
jgi:hypothetical protein